MSRRPARPEAPRSPEAAAARAPLDASLFFKLIRVVNLTARPFHEHVGKQHALRLTEWRVMMVLASHPGIAATEVADLTGLDKMTVSRALAGLQRRGRLRREDDPADQRRSRLYLTPAGQRLYAQIAVTARQREAQLFAGVSEADQHQLSATLDRLAAAGLASEESWTPPRRSPK